MPEQVLALVDCNNFYASCERAFNPKLENRPVVVLSNNDGCVIARSSEAKALGFAMGDPYHLNKDKIRLHNVKVLSSNYALYVDMSRRVISMLGAYARRAGVKRWTGIPVSIGIGPTKTLAKIANRLAKKLPDTGGVFNLFSMTGTRCWIKLRWALSGVSAASGQTGCGDTESIRRSISNAPAGKYHHYKLPASLAWSTDPPVNLFRYNPVSVRYAILLAVDQIQKNYAE